MLCADVLFHVLCKTALQPDESAAGGTFQSETAFFSVVRVILIIHPVGILFDDFMKDAFFYKFCERAVDRRFTHRGGCLFDQLVCSDILIGMLLKI